MKLNYKLQGSGQPIMFIHGVFGSLDNLNMLARDFCSDYTTVQIDLRNHGLSPWSNSMNFKDMAEDVAELSQQLHLDKLIIVGHSLGGKVAFELTQIMPDNIEKLVAIDIAPVKYPTSSNALVLKALAQCLMMQLNDKKQIIAVMQQQGLSDMTIQFLLKSFKNEQWLFNAKVIIEQYQQLCDWQPLATAWTKPALFIRGGDSTYITDQDYPAIFEQFPNAKIELVEGAGHNVHAEKTAQVLQILHSWLMK